MQNVSEHNGTRGGKHESNTHQMLPFANINGQAEDELVAFVDRLQCKMNADPLGKDWWDANMATPTASVAHDYNVDCNATVAMTTPSERCSGASYLRLQ